MTSHVAVLMGGFSAEREVSLSGGQAAAAALRERGFKVTSVDVTRDLPAQMAKIRPDVVYNALHGPFGEDGTVQGLLEFMGIPYTHSGVLASALAMNKDRAKCLFAAAGIRCPKSRLTTIDQLARIEVPERPCVIKPNREGSSVGVVILREPADELPVPDTWPYGREILIEQYVAGRELTVTVLGDRALGVTEIRPRAEFFDYHAKYTEGGAVHNLPAPVTAATYQRALDNALIAHRLLGCRGVSRADFMLAEDDPEALYLLEVNTQPGMTPLSLVPEQAAYQGMSFADLVVWLVEDARCDAA